MGLRRASSRGGHGLKRVFGALGRLLAGLLGLGFGLILGLIVLLVSESDAYVPILASCAVLGGVACVWKPGLAWWLFDGFGSGADF